MLEKGLRVQYSLGEKSWSYIANTRACKKKNLLCERVNDDREREGERYNKISGIPHIIWHLPKVRFTYGSSSTRVAKAKRTSAFAS